MCINSVVTFIIRSTLVQDTRGISIKNKNYPYQPQIGTHICLPKVAELRVNPKVRIVDVEYPASSYFQGPPELTCYGELHYHEFEIFHSWLSTLKDRKELTHQFGHWDIFDTRY